MTTNNITPDEVLDSRDIIDRWQELVGDYVPKYNIQFLQQCPDGEELDPVDALEDQHFFEWLQSIENDEDGEELLELHKLYRECEGYSDWSYGEMLIRDDYFTDYAREMLQDCGEIPRDIPHYVAIDWEQTAENIQVDYTCVNFMDTTYWIRNC